MNDLQVLSRLSASQVPRSGQIISPHTRKSHPRFRGSFSETHFFPEISASDYLNEFGRLLEVRRETEFLQRIFSGCAMRPDHASAVVHTGSRGGRGGRLGDLVARALPRYSAAGGESGLSIATVSQAPSSRQRRMLGMVGLALYGSSSHPAYASLLLRSHLRGGAPLPKAEYIALMQSIEGLAAVGRNLNQIARALNQGGRPALPGPREVVAMVRVAEALRDHFKALLAANARSWEDGRGATSH